MANKIYTHPETAVTFGSGANVSMPNVLSLANGSGALSNPYDFSTNAHASFFEWRARFVCSGSPALSNTIDLFLCTSDDGSTFDGALASGTQLLSDQNRSRNLQYMGSVEIDRALSSVSFHKSGLVEVFARYAAVLVWNNSGANFTGSAGDHLVSLTPVPPEIQ